VPIFRLTDDLIFPPPDLADENGLLAVGGDLSLKRLLLAYSLGIFPWFSEDSPILWWSPDPRLVLFPGDLKISRSLRQTLKKGKFSIKGHG
jgi:leucyl/phenylalanyl-tRNA--protein transferase